MPSTPEWFTALAAERYHNAWWDFGQHHDTDAVRAKRRAELLAALNESDWYDEKGKRRRQK